MPIAADHYRSSIPAAFATNSGLIATSKDATGPSCASLLNDLHGGAAKGKDYYTTVASNSMNEVPGSTIAFNGLKMGVPRHDHVYRCRWPIPARIVCYRRNRDEQAVRVTAHRVHFLGSGAVDVARSGCHTGTFLLGKCPRRACRSRSSPSNIAASDLGCPLCSERHPDTNPLHFYAQESLLHPSIHHRAVLK
jgi:hypothetical protein